MLSILIIKTTSDMPSFLIQVKLRTLNSCFRQFRCELKFDCIMRFCFCMNQGWYPSYACHTRTTLFAVRFASFSSDWVRRVDWPQWEISVKCLLQGHNDKMPDSNIEPAIVRSPTGALPTEPRSRPTSDVSLSAQNTGNKKS